MNTQFGLRLSAPLLLIPALIASDVPHALYSPQAAHAQSNAADLYAQANPAVVTILNGKGHGSGFLINPQGLVITNAHVVADGPKVVTVRLHDGRQVAADVVGYAQDGVDLAALRIYGQPPLPALSLAPQQSVKVGQKIFVIGTPLEQTFNNTLLPGIISRLEADSGVIQHNANTHPGTSGGPLLNERGQVVGVNYGGIHSPVLTAAGQPVGYTPSGLNFAVSLQRLQGFMQTLNRAEQSTHSTLAQPKSEPEITTIDLRGTPLQGQLFAGDEQLRTGQFVDMYLFKGRKRQSVLLNLQSQAFDPNLTLFRVIQKKGKNEVKLVASNDDLGPGDLNAQLQVKLPKDAVYMVVTSSSRPGVQGAYTLQAQGD